MGVPGHEVQRPSIGRVVHFVAPADSPGHGVHGGDHYAATITRLQLTGGQHDHAVDLFVMGPQGTWHERAVTYDASAATTRTWHWPERV